MADVKRTFPETGRRGLERNLNGFDSAEANQAILGSRPKANAASGMNAAPSYRWRRDSLAGFGLCGRSCTGILCLTVEPHYGRQHLLGGVVDLLPGYWWFPILPYVLLLGFGRM